MEKVASAYLFATHTSIKISAAVAAQSNRKGVAMVFTIENPVPPAVLRQVETLKAMEPDWDGYGAPQISADVADRFVELLTEAWNCAAERGYEVRSPSIIAGGDGAVGAHWVHQSKDTDLEVFVTPRNEICLVGTREGEVFEGDASNAEDLVDLLVELDLI